MRARFFPDAWIVELIFKARAGDKVAKDRLWQNFWDVLYRYCHKEKPLRLRPKVGDSDVVQIVLMKANVAFDEFRGKSRQELEDWLLSIARNVIRDLWRHYLRQKRDVSREVPLDELGKKTNHWRGTPLLGKSTRKKSERSTTLSSGSPRIVSC